MSHRNAPVTPRGRARLVSLIIDHGWTQCRAAERFKVSPATAHRWVARQRAGEPLDDRSSRPRTCPNQLTARRHRRVIKLWFTRRWGPHRIGYHLGVARSTVDRVLDRYSMPALACIDQATGLPVRKTPPRRYEKSVPGELAHIDIKKLGRILDGGGWKVHGKGTGQHHRSRRVDNRPTLQTSYRYLHHAVDDYSPGGVLRDPRQRA